MQTECRVGFPRPRFGLRRAANTRQPARAPTARPAVFVSFGARPCQHTPTAHDGEAADGASHDVRKIRGTAQVLNARSKTA